MTDFGPCMECDTPAAGLTAGDEPLCRAHLDGYRLCDGCGRWDVADGVEPLAGRNLCEPCRDGWVECSACHQAARERTAWLLSGPRSDYPICRACARQLLGTPPRPIKEPAPGAV